jgi:hypothetical protein
VVTGAIALAIRLLESPYRRRTPRIIKNPLRLRRSGFFIRTTAQAVRRANSFTRKPSSSSVAK